MPERNSCARIGALAKRTVSAIGVIAVLGIFIGGCSDSSPPSQAKMAAIEKVELHFSLDQGQPLDANIYKCPAVDKPVCSHDYNGSLDCVRVGPKGSVFVERGIDQ